MVAGSNGDIGRGRWARSSEFLLSCMAMSIGLGNVWRFPYVAYVNGGGAFLLPYILAMVVFGRPLLFMEMCLGQYSGSSCVKMWNMVPALRGTGYGMVLVTSLTLSYYAATVATAIFYLGVSVVSTDGLPWMNCDPSLKYKGASDTDCTDTLPWMNCEPGFEYRGIVCKSYSELGMTNRSLDVVVINAAEEYYQFNVYGGGQDISAGGIGKPSLRLTLCLFVTYICTFLLQWKGVRSIGKAAYVTALAPFFTLAALLANSCTLEGGGGGITYFVYPDFWKLLSPSVWFDAIVQCFYTVGVGYGTIITYSSYNRFNYNNHKDTYIILFADLAASLLAGLTIFAILGSLAFRQDVPISEVVSSGPSLAFVAFAVAVGEMPYSQLFSILFFLSLLILGMGTINGILCTITTVVHDLKPHWNKTRVLAVICLLEFLLGVLYLTPCGQAILTLVDSYAVSLTVILFALAEVIGVCWIYGVNRLSSNIRAMFGLRVGIFTRYICWGVVIPTSLVLLWLNTHIQSQGMYMDFTTAAGYPIPAYVPYLVFVISGLMFIQLPLWFFWELCNQEGAYSCSERIRAVWRPNDQWGPRWEDSSSSTIPMQPIASAPPDTEFMGDFPIKF